MIYLDNAATTIHKPQCVVAAVMQAMVHIGNAGRGAHETSLDASRIIYDTRKKLGDLFVNQGAEQVVFTANATEALNIAIRGLIHKEDHVITTQLEHNSVLRPLFHLEEQGTSLTILPADHLGNISYDEMEAGIHENTKAIICTHGSNLTGNMINLMVVGDICERHGILFIVDVSQTAGIHRINMQQMKIDVLCFTGHKGLLGPQGTGGLCVKKGITIPPLLVGGSGIHSYQRTHPTEMPTALEAGTLNGHGIAGLHGALQFLEEQGVEHLLQKEMELMWQFYDGVIQLPGVKVYGDFTSRDALRAPIVALNLYDYDSGQVADELYLRYEIATRAGAHCAPLMHQALGTVEQGAVRFSFSHGNTREEVDQAINAIRILSNEG